VIVPMVVTVTRRIMPLLACAVAVVAAACSSSSASIPPPHSVEKSAAIDTGDSVCKALAADQQKLVDAFKAKFPQATAEDARDFLVNGLTPRIERAVGDFHRIGEPTKDKTDWDKIVSNLDKDLTDFKTKISTDPIGLLTAKPFAAEAPSFDAYGFKDCGKTVA
jgi:hypothetical protein